MPPPSFSDERDPLRQQLLALGVPREITERLLARYDAARIRQQLEWLPYRKANSPSRLLVAAIEGDYAAPAGWQSAGAEPPALAPVTSATSEPDRPDAAPHPPEADVGIAVPLP